MQTPAPPSESQSPQKLSRPRRLRGVLLFLILMGLLILPLAWHPDPYVNQLRQVFQEVLSPFSASFAQQSSPTATGTPEPINQIIPIQPTQFVTPTQTLVTVTQTSSTSSFQTSFPNLSKGWLILSLLDRNFYHLFAYQPTQQIWLQLTDGEWDDLYPAVSPDGQWIAFASNRERFWDIYLLSLQDGNIIPMTRSPHYDGAPTWSPDGKWLAYESYVVDPQTQEGNLEILIQEVNLTGDQDPQVVQLTSIKGADFAPQWSPKGRQIAFLSQRAAENDVWIADLDRIDDRYRNLSGYTASSVQSLSWSAEGEWLVWNALAEGVQWIYRWSVSSPNSPPQKVLPGSQPILTDDGKVLFSLLNTPNHTYLQAITLEDFTYLMPLIRLPAAPKGMAWLSIGLPDPLPGAFQTLPSLAEIDPLEEKNLHQISQTPIRQRLKPLEGIQAPFPYLHEEVFEAFQALREAIIERAGWDFLSRLENAYLPLSSPSFPSSYEEWLYTGRAIALEPAVMNAGWLVAIREEFGGEIYWRLYLKTRYQDGSQGMPLRDLPFDLNARYSGDPLAYDGGGAVMPIAPSGYWIDLTELAQRFGWERLPALTTWRTALKATRYSILIKRDQIDWYSAMLELYPAEALYTATPMPSPTLTPTRTPIPTRTPTPTHTPRPTQTPRITPTPSQLPTTTAAP